MQMQSERRLPRPQQTVWEALNDPEVLRACIPGCEAMERTEPDRFETVVNARFGPLTARVRAEIHVRDPHPPQSYTLHFQGIGRTASLASGEADVNLIGTEDGGCLLQYDARAAVTGKLAKVSSRIVQGTARRMADEFFDNFVAYLGGDPAARDSARSGAGDPTDGGWAFWRKRR